MTLANLRSNTEAVLKTCQLFVYEDVTYITPLIHSVKKMFKLVKPSLRVHFLQI
jgi:hypothetical protein